MRAVVPRLVRVAEEGRLMADPLRVGDRVDYALPPRTRANVHIPVVLVGTVTWIGKHRADVRIDGMESARRVPKTSLAVRKDLE